MDTSTLTCDECGEPTHDDQSAVWVSMTIAGSEERTVCFDCCPPDEED